MKYFKFHDNTHSWILPVWENSIMAENPTAEWSWDKTVKFVCETTQEEYDKQFQPKPKQQEFQFTFD